jgi:hypothetical protein
MCLGFRSAVGRLFIGTCRATWLFSRLRLPHWATATLGGLGVGALAIWVPHVWGNGYEGVNLTLAGEMPLQLIAWAGAGKLVATALSIGSGSSGGVLTPILFVGAALGGLVGQAAHSLWPNVTAQPAAYALVGMSAVLAATTHAPIMSTLMVFEMSLNYNLILPVLVCSGVAALVSRGIKRDSIYTERLRRRGVDIDLAIEETALESIHCRMSWTSLPTANRNPVRTARQVPPHARAGDSRGRGGSAIRRSHRRARPASGCRAEVTRAPGDRRGPRPRGASCEGDRPRLDGD